MVLDKYGRVIGCGIIIINKDCILLERRSDGQGWCLAGGKVENDETIEEAVKREMREETGLIADRILYVGNIHTNAIVRGERREVSSFIYYTKDFICTSESLIPNSESIDFKFVPISYIAKNIDLLGLFEPSREALKLFFKETGFIYGGGEY